MTDVVPGGRRRIDRVLGPEHLADLSTLSLGELHQRHTEAVAEEAELAHLGAHLDERIALVLAEQRRRVSPPAEPDPTADVPGDAATVGVEAVDAGVVDAGVVGAGVVGADVEDAGVVDAGAPAGAAGLGRGTTPGTPADATNGSPATNGASGRLARVLRLRATPDGPPAHRRRRRVERLIADVDLTDVRSRTDDELARVLRTFRQERHKLTDVLGRVRGVVRRCADEVNRRTPPRPTEVPGGLSERLRRTAGSGAAGQPGGRAHLRRPGWADRR